MITLTTPITVLNVLGGNTTVSYEKAVLTNLVTDPVGKTINGTITLSSTSSPNMPNLLGKVEIDTVSGRAVVQSQAVQMYRQITLSGPQMSFVQGLISDYQNAIESGLVSTGFIAGTQSTGV